ncbi:hypothetical protein [Legionella sp. km772]|uniref:hypothetical protein n=1 Tax=Legionella sp. km772 TaxID=2498111 RepID=UPI000F8DCCE1|nr:hypothetical protein [Legionella sp. km772]RUR13128.1 hypothetical protein ELY15_03240 [Legionella sp. km772]
MTFKEFMVGSFRLPARVLSATMTLVFGASALKRDGTVDEKRSFPGLLGLVLGSASALLDLIKGLGRGLTGLIRKHQQAIASAFWMSLLVGGAAALTVALWPAALTAVVNFSIAGYSIASVFGTNFAVQVGATAGIGAVLASAAVYSVAAFANFVSFIKSCCTKAPAANQADFVAEGPSNTSAASLSKLSKGTPTVVADLSVGTAPIHSSILSSKASPKELDAEQINNITATL